MASEKKLEDDFVKRVKKMGGEAIKMNSRTHDGLPDRQALFPLGVICFVEFKSTGEPLQPLQAWWERRMKKLEVKRFTVDNESDLEKVFEWVTAEQDRIFKSTPIPRPIVVPMNIEPACCPKCGDRMAKEVNGFRDAETIYCINKDCRYQHTTVFDQ